MEPKPASAPEQESKPQTDQTSTSSLPLRTIYRATCRTLEVIKEMPCESDCSCRSRSSVTFSAHHSKSCVKLRRTDFPLKRKSNCLGNSSPVHNKKAKSCNASQESSSSCSNTHNTEMVSICSCSQPVVAESIIEDSAKSHKSASQENSADSNVEKDEDLNIEDLNIVSIIEKSYKNRGNFAILQLTPKSAKRAGFDKVATPIKPYSIEKSQRSASLQGISCYANNTDNNNDNDNNNNRCKGTIESRNYIYVKYGKN